MLPCSSGPDHELGVTGSGESQTWEHRQAAGHRGGAGGAGQGEVMLLSYTLAPALSSTDFFQIMSELLTMELPCNVFSPRYMQSVKWCGTSIYYHWSWNKVQRPELLYDSTKLTNPLHIKCMVYVIHWNFERNSPWNRLRGWLIDRRKSKSWQLKELNCGPCHCLLIKSTIIDHVR